MLTAVFLINRMPSPVTNHNSPYQLLHHRPPDYSTLRTFGCSCYPLLPSQARNKLQPKSTHCVFVGYPHSSKGYLCFNPLTHQLITSRHLLFDENTFPYKQLSSSTSSHSTSSTLHSSPPSLLIPTANIPSQNSTQPTPPSESSPPAEPPSPIPTETSSPTSSPPISTSSQSSPPPPNHPMVTRTQTGTRKPKIIFDLLHHQHDISLPLPTLKPPNIPNGIKQCHKNSTHSKLKVHGH